MFHEIIALGRLIRTTPRYTPSGTSVNNFTLAVETGYSSEKKTVWLNCVAFGKLADFLFEHGQKGMVILITGELTPDDNGNPRTYQSKDGNVRATYDITVKTIKVAKWPDKEQKNLVERHESASGEEEVIENVAPF